MKNLFFCFAFVLLNSFLGISQPPPSEKFVKIIVAPERANWTYSQNEKVNFNISIFKNNVLLPNAKVKIEVGPEKMTSTINKEEVLKNGQITVETPGMAQAGFLRCTVKTTFEGKEYKEITTAAIAPHNIKPTVADAADFDGFWSNLISNNRKLDFNTSMTLLPERCTDKLNLYHVGITNWRNGAKLYGILSMPKKPGKYPALLKVPGAGIRPYYGDIGIASEGIIVFEIGIHGIPVNLQQGLYDDMVAQYQNNYWDNNNNDRDQYFFKRVYMGCVKANDFLCSLPEWDGKNLGVTGQSQGGALSLVTAGLDKRVTAAFVIHPALCDLTGDLFDRAGGWPAPFADKSKWTKGSHKDKIEALQYYDAVNFAKRINCPVFFTYGYNDDIVPPTSMLAAYNVINAPKDQLIAYESGHWLFPVQGEKQKEWLVTMLKK